MSTPETPDLLFFDTFSHDTSEELNLDLVQFPKSVYVREIRIIPLGARVEGDFPGGVRLGATNPTKFQIDFFVNDLSKPGASTFEALGSLEYCQNGQIHMECGTGSDQPQIPTDGLVLKGWYTTITLAVYGNLTQVVPESPISVNPPASVPRPAIVREPPPVQQPLPQNPEWTQESPNPIPSYTGNIVTANPETYGPSNYPENYDAYRGEYYDPNVPKDPRTYHHLEEPEWDKRALSCERDDRLRRSSRSMELDRRDGRSRRRSQDRRSRESSRLRDRSRELDRLRSRSRSRDREYSGKEYRPQSRSRSRSIRGASGDRDWDRGSYKKDEYRRHRDSSYDRSRGGSHDKDSASYERRSPFEKRSTSYERKPYEKRGPSYEKRESSYERRAPSYEKGSPYDRKRHSPYPRIRGSSFSSRSPSRDDPRKRPRTPPGETRRPLSPREGEASSPINSLRSEDAGEFDRKQIPRVDFYHQSYRHKNPIRSPSQEVEPAPYVEPHTSLVTVPIVDNPPKAIESPVHNPDDEKSDGEQFEPILSDEDICDDLEGTAYMDVDYDVNEYCGVDDIIKYYNPFKCEWKKYRCVNTIHLLGDKTENSKDVLTAPFEDICEASADLFKIMELLKTFKKSEHKISINTFMEIENSSREDWVHQCEQVYVATTNLCKSTDIMLRIFPTETLETNHGFDEIRELLLTFAKIGLNFEFALAQQQPTYKIRHIKCGIRLAEALTSHRHNETVVKYLLSIGIDLPMQLLDIYSKEYMALSIRLMILKSLNGCLSSRLAIDNFMKQTVFPKFDKNETDRKAKNGYQALIAIMQGNPLTRIKFSISALIKKLNVYELLGKLHDLVLRFDDKMETGQKLDADLSESDVTFIVDALEEVLQMYRTQCFHISQPKRFLPVSAQFDISKECSNEILLEFFNIHEILQVCLYILTCPSTYNNLVVVSPIHDLIHELIHSENGINFLYRNMELSELLFKTLIQPYGQNPDEFIYPHDLSNYSELQVLGLELAYRLKAFYHLKSIRDLQAGKEDENELIDRLQSLYCLSFGSVGKIAVPDVIVMGDNADCLMDVFEVDVKSKGKPESPAKQKSPAKGYAIELIGSAIRFSADVPFLKKYGQRLIAVSKDHDRFEPSVSSVLQEVIPFLKPIEKASVLAGEDMAELVEIVKLCSEHAPDLPGELTTCLRILRHFCISDYDKNITVANETATEEYVELKYKYNVLQLFSLDGVAHLADILEKLVTHFDQPSMHSAVFAAARGLQLAQLMLPSLRLLDEMLARVVRCRGARFRDLGAAPVLLRAYGLARAFPAGCVAARTAARAADAAVRALLAYAQPSAEEAPRRGPWTALCGEVIAYTMSAPCAFVPGLLAFSELLPLPLPLRTRAEPRARELAAAAAERRLWAAHLHARAPELGDMVRVICTSAYRPVVHMLRRVCAQLADLAPSTASTVARAALDALAAELRPPEPAGAAAARVLGFLACLVSHAPVKCAVLYAMRSAGDAAGGGGGLQGALCAVLGASGGGAEHAAAQEFAAHALAALCDAEISMLPVATSAPELVVASSLPSEEALAAWLDATAACLAAPARTAAVALAVLRAYFALTEHEYGFRQFRKFVSRSRLQLRQFLEWSLAGGGGGGGGAEERAECLSVYVELARVLRAEEAEGGALARRSVLALHEMADMVGYSPGEADHPILKLESILKERNAEDDALVANFVVSHLLKLESSTPPAPPAPATPEPAGVAAPLAAQWQARAVHVTVGAGAGAGGEGGDDRLTASYWLNLPVVGDEDDAHDNELVVCDLVEIAKCQLSGAGAGAGGAGGAGGGCGGEALCAAVRRLAGCLDARQPARPSDDKRPAVAWSRARGEGGDAFRSRPPNTSRPPSLHVDDFTAMHRYPPHHQQPHPHTNRGMRRGGGAGAVAVSDRGRFASAAPMHAHYRHLRGRGAWEMGASHFGHFPPSSQYMMGGMGWGGGRMPRGPRHRNFMR